MIFRKIKTDLKSLINKRLNIPMFLFRFSQKSGWRNPVTFLKTVVKELWEENPACSPNN
jgi:hypothetical protein